MALLHRMAWLCALLVLVITSLSAFIRLSKAGLGCDPWPACYAQEFHTQPQGVTPVLATTTVAEATTATAIARLAHRVIASSALLLILVMVMTALASRPALWPQGRIALGLLLLALFLAILGRWTAHARVPAVTLGNLVAGFAMFALSVRMVLATRTNTPPPAAIATTSVWLSRGAWLAGAVLLLQAALGGLVSAGYAGLSCPHLTGCDVGSASWQALDPWFEPLVDAAQPTHPQGAWVHLLHRTAALVVAGVLLPLVALAWRNGRRTAALTVLTMLVLQAGLGVALVLGSLPLAVALAHNVVAALLLGAVAVLPNPAQPHQEPRTVDRATAG